jgi:hypothetical protein
VQLTPDRVSWAYWIAAALALLGALTPLVLAHGQSSRVLVAVAPFALAAGLLAANGFVHQQGRPLSTILFFVAGLAIVYAVLAMVSLPIRLAVVGTCPVPPQPCPTGIEPILRDYESSSITGSVTLGILAIGAGFVGLMILFRRKKAE